MTVEIKLFKRTGTYEKDGKEKQFTNFYIGINDKLIPVEVKYFPNKALNDRDPGYQARVGALEVVAELLPEVPTKEKNEKVNVDNVVCPKCGKKMRVDDKDEVRKGVLNYWFVCDECNSSGYLDGVSGELTFEEGEDSPMASQTK